MKKITLLLAIFAVSFGFAQDPPATTLPYDFETSPVTTDILAFDGAGVSVEAVVAPQTTGNSSTNLMKLVRNGGQVWAGCFTITTADFDFAAKPYINARIWTEAPIGTKIMFKTENSGDAGNNSGEKDYFTKKTGEWETINFNFTGVGNAAQNKLVIIPANGVLGDGTATSTFFIDDITNTAAPVLSTNDFGKIYFKVSPNPSSSVWNVSTQNKKILSINVFDVLGKQVLSLSPNNESAIIDGTSFKSGLYFAQIKTANGLESLKLIRK